MGIFAERQITSDFLKGSSLYHPCPPPSLSLSSASLSPPPSFTTPAMCEHRLNGCGDDELCLAALWVMSGSPCIAVNVEAEHWVSETFSWWMQRFKEKFISWWPKTIFNFMEAVSCFCTVMCEEGEACAGEQKWWDCAHDMSLRLVQAGAALCRPHRDTGPAEELSDDGVTSLSDRERSCLTISSLSP